jgi:hypothetical protein
LTPPATVQPSGRRGDSPRLEVFMSTQNMTALASLPARIRVLNERAEREAERRRKRDERSARDVAVDRAGEYLDGPGGRYRHIGPEAAAKVARVPLQWLLRVTKGQAFRFDFGRARNGERLILFRFVELVAWAKRQARTVGH